jgi:hypothetical protein
MLGALRYLVPAVMLLVIPSLLPGEDHVAHIYLDCWSACGELSTTCFPAPDSPSGFGPSGQPCANGQVCQDWSLGPENEPEDPANCPPWLTEDNGCGFYDPLPPNSRVNAVSMSGV